MLKAFRQSLEKVADTWTPLSVRETPTDTAKLHTAYVHAGTLAMHEAYTICDDNRIKQLTLRQRGAMEHGAKVIMRYYDHAVTSAARQHVPLDLAVEFLASEDGLDTLSQVARQPNNVAKHIEGFLCIGQDSVCTFESPEDTVYKWDDHTLTHPSLEDRMASDRKQYVANTNSDINPEIMCRAEKVHQLGPIAASLLVICSQDPQLFADTYTRHTDVH